MYTQSNDRLWRKNRQTTSGSTCLGHDINRNWDSHWAVTGGASTDPCADDFKGMRSPNSAMLFELPMNVTCIGRAAADAPETKVLAAFNNKLAAAIPKLKLFIDYHSYSQLFMTRKCPKSALPFPPVPRSALYSLRPIGTSALSSLPSAHSVRLLLYRRRRQQQRLAISRHRCSRRHQSCLRHGLSSRSYLYHDLPSHGKQRRLRKRRHQGPVLVHQ